MYIMADWAPSKIIEKVAMNKIYPLMILLSYRPCLFRPSFFFEHLYKKISSSFPLPRIHNFFISSLGCCVAIAATEVHCGNIVHR